MKHPLQEMMDKRRQGIRCGIPSYCSANELVIEIALRRAKERSIPVLIEATANQVNQFGGYTGMKPADFYQMVLKMAKDIDLPENMMILAGDHLGPLTWQKLPEAEAMKNSVELVVQPGVEFGDEQVFDYDPAAAVDLCAALKEFPDICFEGHSTDYQTAADLYNMVTDGIAILKVGPALTYGLREALFSLSMMEKELVPEEKRANFIETLDAVMLASPANWEKHYHGDEKHLAQCRKYSYSDRARYYIGQPEVVAAMNKLFDNLRAYPIPMNMLHQYMPISYAKIREGKLKLDPRELAMDGIVQFMLDYESAV